jgi:hypothetical protein
MERTDTTNTEKTGLKGTWLVIFGIAGKYIARTLKTREEVLAIQAANGRLDTDDCFEFSSSLQVRPALDPRTQQPVGMTFSKQTIAYRVDATLFATPLSFSLMGSTVYFLDDLKEADAVQYKDIIRDAINMGEKMLEQRVQERTGIVTPANAGAIPPLGSLVR